MNSTKKQGIFFLLGVSFFALGVFLFDSVTINVFGLDFNPYYGIGVVMFGIGSVKPFYGLIKKCI